MSKKDVDTLNSASVEYGRRLADRSEEMFRPLARAREEGARLMRDAGMIQSETLAVAGTHIGTIVGGFAGGGMDPHLVLEHLLVLWAKGAGATEASPLTGMAGSQREYLTAVEPILYAALKVAECCIADGRDHEKAMRAYLGLLVDMVAHVVSGAGMLAQPQVS